MAHIRKLIPYTPYALLSLLVVGPLLWPGFVLTMDMVFTPVLRMPDHVDNTWLFYATLHILNLFLPADFIQKGMLVAILLVSGVGVHRFLRLLRQSSENNANVGVCVGSMLYMINPFVYDRFMAGQYGVLLGYSLLPWFAASLWRFTKKPGWRSILAVTVWATGMSILSIHSLGWVVVLVIGAALMSVRDQKYLRRMVKFGGFGIALFAILGAYWIIPAVSGSGRIAQSLSTFSSSERQTFATVDPNGTTQLGAVVGLQGFWEETRQLYILPLDATPEWGWVQVAFLVIVWLGAWRAYQTQRRMAHYAGGVFVVVVFLALGIGGDWMAHYVPFFAGFREPQKFVALIALVYAYFAAHGVAWMVSGVEQWHKRGVYPIAALLVLVVLGYTSPMLWGFYGQVRPVQYPVDWFVVNTLLNQQSDDSKVLFLPWHLYMSFGFSGRIIANPAANFFDKPMITSDDPELPGATPQTRNVMREYIQTALLPAGACGEPITPKLKALNVGYVLLAKELDWQDYAWLNRQSGVKLIHETANLRLYKLTNDTIGLHENN